ncbi:MAG: hypothetical protein ACI9OJ_002408, partial [Myxococcota bacterium]
MRAPVLLFCLVCSSACAEDPESSAAGILDVVDVQAVDIFDAASDAVAPEVGPDTPEADVPAALDIATPKDGTENLPPTIRIEPAAPTTLDDLSAVVAISSAAGSTELTFRWFKGDESTEHVSAVLSADETSKSETWSVTVQHDDGPVGTASVTIANSSPGCAAATIAGAGTASGESAAAESVATVPLTCSCTAFEDVDSDQVTARCQWEIDDVLISEACVLEANAASKGQTVRCVLTPDDGDLLG